MICQRCLQRFAQRTAAHPRAKSSPRSFSTTTRQKGPAVSAQTTTATNPRPNDLPAATSTSAAQPFSAPLSPAPRNQDLPINTEQTAQVAKVVSSVPAGTVLKGLNFMKNQQDPVALEDHEYPAWLWDALNKKSGAAGGAADAEGDMFSKSKKQRRLAAKALRKQQLLNPESLVPKVPIYEQTIDLPSGDGSLQGAKEAERARADLTKAMREKRRSKIKEDNFLKEMR